MILGTAVCMPHCEEHYLRMSGAISVYKIDTDVVGGWRGSGVLEAVVCREQAGEFRGKQKECGELM
jgi:hypothetical protein